MFPKFSLEPGFAQGADPLWNKDKSESVQSADLRAQAVVDKIFKSEPKEKICKRLEFKFSVGWLTSILVVSITAHHEINGAIISALGGNPANYPRHTGGKKK